tara:strand:+ start:33 stop:254 length:222 start_codon:yes stop_codon:yes gene_type:complete
MTEYEMKLANHNNFYQKQMDVAMRLRDVLLNQITDIKSQEVIIYEAQKEIKDLNEAKSMTKPNPPNYYRANND